MLRNFVFDAGLFLTLATSGLAQAPPGSTTVQLPKRVPKGVTQVVNQVPPFASQALLATISIASDSDSPIENHSLDIGYVVTNTGLSPTPIVGSVVIQFQGQTLRAPDGNLPPNVTLESKASSIGVVRVGAPKAGTSTITAAFLTPAVCSSGPLGSSGQPIQICKRSRIAGTSMDITVAPDTSSQDLDNDGIPDATEDALLARYRPYYRFSTNKGSEEPDRPADPIWYIRHSTLLTDGDENSPILVSNASLIADPLAIFATAPGIGSSSFSATHCSGQFFLNPANEYRPGYYNGDGTDWPQILATNGIGLYGHVAKDPDEPSIYRLEYWQFYGYNEAGQVNNVASHEGDWEGITVLVDANDPFKYPSSVTYYVHDKSITFNGVTAALANKNLYDYAIDEIGPRYILHGANYSEIYNDGLDAHNDGDLQNMQNSVLQLYCDQQVQCTHPVVYVEWGTHASWPAPQWGYIGAPSHNGGGQYRYLTATPPNLGEDWAPRSTVVGSQVILNYNGHWGAFSRSLPGFFSTSAPHGPALHNRWARPNAGRPPASCLE